MIVRIEKAREKPYVVLDRKPLRMEELSLKARGLWALCMSFPDDWMFRPRHLATLSKHDGESAVRSALAELKEVGLASYDQPRKLDGTLGKGEWTIYENPRFQRNEPDGENCKAAKNANSPDGGYPHAVQPNAAQPHAVNQTLRSNDVRSKEKRSNEGSNSNAHAREHPDPTIAGVNNSSHELLMHAAALVKGERGKEEQLAQLVARGVDPAVAVKLVSRYSARHIDAILKRGEREAKGPGWYVDAFRKGYTIHEEKPERTVRYLHHQALRLIEEHGIVIDQAHPLTNYFDVAKDNGSTYFVATEKMRRFLG